MDKSVLHITNGGILTSFLKDLDFEGDILTWQEMLCEGSTVSIIDNEEFLQQRKAFLNTYYDIEIDVQEYKSEIDILNHTENYSKIILWFEYDLFCHINLLAVINLIKEKQIQLPLYLVCSGRIESSKNLKGLGELNQKQLLEHYKNKILLSEDDIDLAKSLWDIYCGKDHNLLKPYITKKSSFLYLGSCLKAHLKRFPDLKTGLCVLEKNILVLVRDNDIHSRHHLLGYVLNYQGYYGYGDIQINRMIENLSIFFTKTKNSITLNRKGHVALLGSKNFALEVNNNIPFGGISRLDFYYSANKNQLIKNPIPCPLKNLSLY